MAGAALRIADNQLAAGVFLFTMIAMDAEVIRVVKAASVPGIDLSVPKDFLGNGSRILTEITGNMR